MTAFILLMLTIFSKNPWSAFWFGMFIARIMWK